MRFGTFFELTVSISLCQDLMVEFPMNSVSHHVTELLFVHFLEQTGQSGQVEVVSIRTFDCI